jgi:hypothetical protein
MSSRGMGGRYLECGTESRFSSARSAGLILEKIPWRNIKTLLRSEEKAAFHAALQIATRFFAGTTFQT